MGCAILSRRDGERCKGTTHDEGREQQMEDRSTRIIGDGTVSELADAERVKQRVRL